MQCWWGIATHPACGQGQGATPDPRQARIDLKQLSVPGLHRPQSLNKNQSTILEATRHAWQAYEAHAWGADELRPLSRKRFEWFGSGLAFTLIDSLDTLWLMGLDEELARAREFILTSWPKKLREFRGGVNTFETTIRILGGLLGAFTATGDGVYLEAAVDMGKLLLPAMRTKSGVPFSDVDLAGGFGFAPSGAPHSSLSEATSIQLEFKYLGWLMRKHADKVDHAVADEMTFLSDKSMNAIVAASSQYQKSATGSKLHPGLLPIYISVQTGRLQENSHITVGARGDSYYEYLIKQYLQTNKREKHFRSMYNTAIAGICEQLVRETSEGLTFVGELLGGKLSSFSPKMDHLVCFLPGTLALGHLHGVADTGNQCPGGSHLQFAIKLMETCVAMYTSTTTGLAPEIVWFAEHDVADDGKNYGKMEVKPNDAFSLLRPETVESLFILWRVTQDQRWRDYGFSLFQAFNRHGRISGNEGNGFAAVENVNAAAPSQKLTRRDKMESFFIAETLKYFFLLFEDDDTVFPLDKVVLNTEAHAFPMLQGPVNRATPDSVS